MSDYSVITSDFVSVSITNSGNQMTCVERRFQKGITIDDFKVICNVNTFIYIFEYGFYSIFGFLFNIRANSSC